MKRNFFLLIIITVLVQTVSSQTDMPRTNWKNSLGQREGVWILTNGYTKFEAMYEHGQRVHTLIEITPDGKIPVFGRYTEEGKYDNWYHFDDDANLVCYLYRMKIDYQTPVRQANGTCWYADFRCFYIEYYPNGNVKKNGRLLWSKGAFPLDGSAIAYGLWETYDESGKLISIYNSHFTPFYNKLEAPTPVPCDYKWALSDEPILLPYIE